MTVLVEDSFDRTGANLGSNPAGRWSIPVGDFSVDGQTARTYSTITASTSPFAFAYGVNPGTTYGEWRITAKRGTTEVKAIGILARCSTAAATYDRYWFGWTNESGTEKFELRLYYSTTLYYLLSSVTASTLGITANTSPHIYALKITRHTTGLAPIDIVAKYDGTVIFNIVAATDYFSSTTSTQRTVGFQLTTSSAWATATDYATFDNAQIDDLATPSIESAPTLTTESSLTPITVAVEVDSIASAGTFPTPDFGESITERYWTVRSRSDAGYETTFARFTAGRRLWHVRWTTISSTDLGIVKSYLRSTSYNGATVGFNYSSPDGTTYTCRIVEDSLAYEQTAPNVYNAEAVIEALI